MDQRYNVTVGASIVKAEAPAFADFGVRYANMDYAQMVEVEAILAKHAEDITKGMAPVIESLMAVGIEEVKKKATPLK